MNIAGTWDAWPVLFAFNVGPALICLLCLPFCPESPRYLLIKRNDEEGARKGKGHLNFYTPRNGDNCHVCLWQFIFCI